MRKKRTVHKVIQSMIVLLIVFAVQFKLTAAGPGLPDLTQKGSIAITMEADTDDGTFAVGGGRMSLRKVAFVVIDNADMHYQYEAAFAEAQPDLEDYASEDFASDILAFALEHTVPGEEKTIDDEGQVRFTELEPGLYLLEQVEAPEGYSKIKPFAVSVPLKINGQWNYAIDASPKMDFYHALPSTTPEETTTASESTAPEESSGTSTSEHPSESTTPEESAETSTPSESTSPEETSSEDSTTTTYEASESVSSDVTSAGTTREKLPHTGQLKWPAAVLAVGGILLLIAGIVLYAGKKRENDET